MAAQKLKPSDKITALGVTKTITEFAQDLGVPVQTILGRLARGWSNDRAVSEPAGSKGGQNRGKKTPAEVLTPDELVGMLGQCSDGATGIRNRAMIVVGWRAGLRIDEALSLTPANLEPPPRQTVRILHGKGNKARTVGLDAQAWAVVATWLEARAAAGIGPEQTLFCTLQGGKLSDRYVRELMPRLAKGAGINKRVHFHGLRHTHAFELAAEGLALNLIQQQLGHGNVAVTSKYISHLNPAETINRIKSRTWGTQPAAVTNAASGLPAPGWLDRLKADVESRLVLFHDGRSNEVDFKVAVLLF